MEATNLFPVSAFHLLLDDVLGEWTAAVVLWMRPLDLGAVFIIVHYFWSARFARRICMKTLRYTAGGVA